MLHIVAMKSRLVFTAAILFCVFIARGDEQLFGFVRGTETLPRASLGGLSIRYIRQRKERRNVLYGTHFETEAEYRFTDEQPAQSH